MNLSKLSQWTNRAFAPALNNMQYAKRRMRPLAVVAVIGFPLYYYVWRDLFPQPYENLWLRVVGSVLFVPIIFHDRWPATLQKYLPWYWYASALYALPFFFGFMLLKNGGTEVWVESALIAVFVMVLLLDWLMLVLHFVVGISLAVVAYCLTTQPVELGYLAHLAIFSFAIGIGALANYDLERVRIEQERAMLATASSVAHELRTPLLAIRAGAAGLTRFLPALLDSYAIAQRGQLPVPKIRIAHLLSMQGVLARVEQEALHSNGIIDMLLANARFTGGYTQPFSRCSIEECVRVALARYPFRDDEQQRVHCDLTAGFEFEGSEMLMVHVLFNLLKNAFRHMSGVSHADITIRLLPSSRDNRLIFRDTGRGIDADALPHVFTRFYTSSGAGEQATSPDTASADVSPSTGIGLAFCRDVMRSFGGAIECSSVKGQYTEFVLIFPLP